MRSSVHPLCCRQGHSKDPREIDRLLPAQGLEPIVCLNFVPGVCHACDAVLPDLLGHQQHSKKIQVPLVYRFFWRTICLLE